MENDLSKELKNNVPFSVRKYFITVTDLVTFIFLYLLEKNKNRIESINTTEVKLQISRSGSPRVQKHILAELSNYYAFSFYFTNTEVGICLWERAVSAIQGVPPLINYEVNTWPSLSGRVNIQYFETQEIGGLFFSRFKHTIETLKTMTSDFVNYHSNSGITICRSSVEIIANRIHTADSLQILKDYDEYIDPYKKRAKLPY